MIEQMIDAYRDALKHPSAQKVKNKKTPSPIEDVLRSAVHRRWKNLAEERIDDVRPKIPLRRRFWTLSKEETTELKTLFSTESARKLVTGLKSRNNDAQIEVVDAAYWIHQAVEET